MFPLDTVKVRITEHYRIMTNILNIDSSLSEWS